MMFWHQVFRIFFSQMLAGFLAEMAFVGVIRLELMAELARFFGQTERALMDQRGRHGVFFSVKRANNLGYALLPYVADGAAMPALSRLVMSASLIGSLVYWRMLRREKMSLSRSSIMCSF